MNETIIGIVVNIISSVIYDTGLIGLNAGKNALTQKKMQQQVFAKVHAELEKLEGEGLLFQGTAFIDYLNHMQPIQKIVHWVMAPEKHSDSTEKEFVTSVLEDTVCYLRAQGMTVGVTECSLLEEFYNRLMRISRDILYSNMDTGDRALGNMIQQFMEAGEKRTALEIQTAGKRLEHQADRNHNALQSQINQLMAGMSGTQDSDAPLVLRNFSTAYTMPYKYQQGSDKEELIQQVTSNLRSRRWIHLFGKMFTGKTQALVRVAERLGSYVWISVEEHSFLQMQPMELPLEEDAVVILDGIPNIANGKVKEKCLQLLEECKKRKCRLITSGYEDIIPYLKGYVQPGELVCMEIEGLTASEVDEIAKRHGAPEQLLHTKGYHSFVEICKSLPPVVMEVIHRMEDNGWQFDDEVFTAILQRRTDTLTEQITALFQESVREEETRHLYYRMIYAGQTISAAWIRPIAEIPQRIPDVDMRIEKLRNRWYYKEGQVYQSPNAILAQYAEEQLGQAEKEQINKFLVKETIKHPLDVMDVTNLFHYYSRLEEYDSEGMLCIQLLQSMVQEGIKDYYVHPENFWTGTSMPEKMSPMIKCYVRLEQVYYKAWKGDKNPIGNLDVEWLWEIAAQEPLCRELITVQFIRLAMVCADASLKLFQALLEKQLEFFQWDEEFRQKLELEDKDNILCKRSLFVAYNEMLCLNIKNKEQLEMYVECMEQYFAQEQWLELEQTGDMDAMLFHMLSQVTGVNEPETIECSDLIGRFYKLLDYRKTPKIWRSVLHFYIVQMQTEEGYQKAWEMYESVRPVLEGRPALFCEIIDTMARIAHDNKDEEREKQMFGWEMNVIPQMENEELNNVIAGSCLLYMDKLTTEDLEEVEKTHRVLQHIAEHICPAEDFPYISEKLEAAYWMKIWQLGMLKQKMSSFIQFVRRLLEAYDAKDEVPLRAILTKMVHVLGYISGVLVHGQAPDKLKDGSDYASPAPLMFWNSVNENDVVQYWKPEKREMAYCICAELAEQCGETDLASELFAKMLCKADSWTNDIMHLYRADAYMELKILEFEKLDMLTYIMSENYRERTLPKIEKDSEFLCVNREILLISLHILQLYRKDKCQGLDFCRKFLETLKETEFRPVPRTYYQEYRKILELVIGEDADYELLRYAFHQIQKRQELANMDSAIFPLLQMEAPKENMDMLNRNLENAVKVLKMDKDFMVARMM